MAKDTIQYVTAPKVDDTRKNIAVLKRTESSLLITKMLASC